MQAAIGNTPSEIIHSMADAMRNLGESCTERALILRGLTRQQIEKYGERAVEMANRLSTRNSVVRVVANRAA